jgi:hypothetical protein
MLVATGRHVFNSFFSAPAPEDARLTVPIGAPVIHVIAR